MHLFYFIAKHGEMGESLKRSLAEGFEEKRNYKLKISLDKAFNHS